MKENVEQIGYLQDTLSGPVDKSFDRFYFVVNDLLLEEGGKRLGLAIEELGADHLFFGSDYPPNDGHLDTAATYESPWKIFNEDTNISEDALRLEIEQAKRSANVSRKVSLTEI